MLKNTFSLEIVARQLFVDPELIQSTPLSTFKSLLCVNKAIRKMILEQTPLSYLRAHQYGQHLRLIKGLQRYRKMIDTSLMGRGKTYVSCSIWKQLGWHKIIIFGPEIVEMAWKKAFKHFSISEKRVEFYSYTSMRKKVKPYLKSSQIAENGFVPNPEWYALIQKGILLIFDESHHLKNESQQSKLLTILSQSLLQESETSALLCLSATPFDKPANAVRMARILNIVRQPELAINHFGQYQITGYQDLLDFCRAFHINVNGNHMGITGNAQSHLVDVWNESLVRELCAAMPPKGEESKKAGIECFNVFSYVKDQEGLQKIQKGVAQIRNSLIAIAANQGRQNISVIADIARGMKTIEKGKAFTFAQKVIHTFKAKSMCKVIVMCNYLKPIGRLCGLLAEYKPLVVTGATLMNKRKQYIEWFQQPNLDYRLLIVNISVMSEGIDLDDKDGRFERVMFVSPSYYLIRQHQATHRICREDSKSKATVYFLYAKQCSQEPKLLDSLVKKSDILKANLEYKITLPGGYPQLEM